MKDIVMRKPMSYEDYEIGFIGSFTKAVTVDDNELFGILSGDLNPIHFDDSAAQKFGFKSKISNGFVTESRIAAALVETFGTKQTVVIALEKNTRFLSPVFMGDEITATVEVIGKIEALRVLRIRAACFNQDGVQVVSTKMVIKLLSF